MSFSEKRLGGKTVYDGKILKLVVDDVRLDDGSAAKREIIRHSGGAAALYAEDGKILLVKQFRYAYGKEMYEIPAGRLNEGEDPSFAAKRELEEETGLVCDMSPFLTLYPSPGYTDEVTYVFLAQNSTRSRQKLDLGEFLTFEFIPAERVVKMIESGEICDAKTVAAVYKYLTENV